VSAQNAFDAHSTISGSAISLNHNGAASSAHERGGSVRFGRLPNFKRSDFFCVSARSLRWENSAKTKGTRCVITSGEIAHWVGAGATVVGSGAIRRYVPVKTPFIRRYLPIGKRLFRCHNHRSRAMRPVPNAEPEDRRGGHTLVRGLTLMAGTISTIPTTSYTVSMRSTIVLSILLSGLLAISQADAHGGGAGGHGGGVHGGFHVGIRTGPLVRSPGFVRHQPVARFANRFIPNRFLPNRFNNGFRNANAWPWGGWGWGDDWWPGSGYAYQPVQQAPVPPQVIVIHADDQGRMQTADVSYVEGCRAIPNGYHCDLPSESH